MGNLEAFRCQDPIDKPRKLMVQGKGVWQPLRRGTLGNQRIGTGWVNHIIIQPGEIFTIADIEGRVLSSTYG